MSSGNGRRSGRNGLEVRYGTTKASVKKKKKEDGKKRKKGYCVFAKPRKGCGNVVSDIKIDFV